MEINRMLGTAEAVVGREGVGREQPTGSSDRIQRSRRSPYGGGLTPSTRPVSCERPIS
jgi:hypothetical protein